MPKSRRFFRNYLLDGLPPVDIALLDPLEYVALPLRFTLEAAETKIEQIYFIEQGVASVVAQTAGQRDIEIGVIGPEGMTGQALLHADNRSPFETFMQIEGVGYRLPADRLIKAIGQSDNLRVTLLRYSRAFNLQVAATSVANGSSKLEERLARWLLMVGDRVGGSFSITHAFLATMLAVRRPGVTLALQILEGRGLIRSSRGNVLIVDRDGLIEASNGSYGMAEREHQRLHSLRGIDR